MTSRASPIVGTTFDEIEIFPALITGVFRDNDRDEQGILPFYAAPTVYLVELSFDGGERQGLWMGSDPEVARSQALSWAERLAIRVVDRSSHVGLLGLH
jgi:hypothetical protein